jgi:hypothetical protein
MGDFLGMMNRVQARAEYLLFHYRNVLRWRTRMVALLSNSEIEGMKRLA